VTLRHALLALIEAGPTTGYDLAKQFDRSVSYIWHARHSQIYTELRRLERAGLIASDVLPRGSKELATKRAYRLTEPGGTELMRWVAETETPDGVRDPAYVKATYLEYGSAAVARAFFRAHRRYYESLRDRYEAHIDELQARATPLLRRRLEQAPAASHDAIVAFKVHAYRGMVARARAEIAWADRGLELVATLDRNDRPEPILDPRHSS